MIEKPTLTDQKGNGGIIALDGFEYQISAALVHLPMWLKRPNFEGLIIEGLEDFEARFFAPQSPHKRLLERYQAKSGTLSRTDLKSVIESFFSFDASYPKVAISHTLLAQDLAQNIKWILRDHRRVRSARTFYDPFADILGESEKKYEDDLKKEFDEKLASYFVRNVDIERLIISDRTQAKSLFSQSLSENFPNLAVNLQAPSHAFDKLYELLYLNRGRLVSRISLQKMLESTINASLDIEAAFPLLIISDRNESDTDSFAFDARQFSSKENRFPSSKKCKELLSEPLLDLSHWLRREGYIRVELKGSYRLSTAFSLGWSLRSASGFEIDISTKDGIWSTDDHPMPTETYPAWTISEATSLQNDTLTVTIGVLRDPLIAIGKNENLDPTSVASFFLNSAVPDGHSAQHGIAEIKRALANLISRLTPAKINLYYAGPASFAIALGHRWNGFPTTQFHEFMSSNQLYAPSTYTHD